MYSCTSLGVKLGGGLGTAITGWLLAFSNYDKALAVQPESCINMLKLMCLVIPFGAGRHHYLYSLPHEGRGGQR